MPERLLRNSLPSCLTSTGEYPSEKVLGYKPRTLLDLVNPKNGFKHQSTETSHSNDLMPIEPLEHENLDPFAKLAVGDKVYYRNFRDNEYQRWIESKYIKRISKNMFQIAIGSHPVSAHGATESACED